MSRLVVFYLFNGQDVWMCTQQDQQFLKLQSLVSEHQHFMTHEVLTHRLAKGKLDITANAALAVLQASAIIARWSHGPGTQLAKR